LHATLSLLKSTTFDGSHPAISGYTYELGGEFGASRHVWHRLCPKGQGGRGNLPTIIMPCEAKTGEAVVGRIELNKPNKRRKI
jgi:hypothetical protein